jgi:hypothetical protein
LPNDAAPQSSRTTDVGAEKNAMSIGRAGQRKTQPVANVPHQLVTGGGLHLQFSHAPRFKPNWR